MKIVLKMVETLIEIKDKDILNELIERFEQIYSLIGTEVLCDKLLEMLEDLNNWEGKTDNIKRRGK